MSIAEWTTCDNGHQYSPDLDVCPYCPAPTQTITVERSETPTGRATVVESDTDRTHAKPHPTEVHEDGVTAISSDGAVTPTHVVGGPSGPASGHEDRLTRAVAVDDKSSAKRMPILAWIVVLEGAQQYQDFRIAQDQVYIGGSAEECDIVLKDEFVSGVHASIRFRDDGLFYITDLDSKNGTLVNDMSPEARIDRVHLKDGDEIRVGQVLLKFKCL